EKARAPPPPRLQPTATSSRSHFSPAKTGGRLALARGTFGERWPRACSSRPGQLHLTVHALLGSSRAAGDVANGLLRILSGKGLLSRTLSLDAFVCLPVSTSDVSLPEVHCGCLLPPESIAAERDAPPGPGVGSG